MGRATDMLRRFVQHSDERNAAIDERERRPEPGDRVRVIAAEPGNVNVDGAELTVLKVWDFGLLVPTELVREEPNVRGEVGEPINEVLKFDQVERIDP